MTQMIEMIGRRYKAEITPLTVELEYHSPTRLTFTMIDGGGITPNGHAETVPTVITQLAPHVYFVSWIEESGSTVTHVEDIERGTLLSNATLPDGAFINMAGTIREIGIPEMTSQPPEVEGSADRLVGKTVETSFDDLGVSLLTFEASDSLSIRPASGAALDRPERTVSPTITAVRPDLYLATWREANTITISQIYDLTHGKTYSNVTLPNGEFHRLVGSTKIVK